MQFKPDFLIKPYEVHAHPGLRPSDGDVYAVVYWFEKMVNGKCTASNETIAEVACVKERSVGASLERLEQFGFIKRTFTDDTHRHRKEIKALVHMTKDAKGDEPPILKTKGKKVKTEKIEPGAIIPFEEQPEKVTPGDIARDFFAPSGTPSKWREEIINEIVDLTGAPRQNVIEEIRKFYAYWTEPTKSGKKQRWETEPTFEVKRRIATWLSRSGKYNTSKPASRTGAGVSI